ncbi:MAG: chemotaxis-specific protein-glutamate methyltransferase CheB [Desulfamplus sp.]|nr:chemotaxis-specific protein-glutamate methyltransferase CheB [Desulfamplus sp.]MBF0413259.1 chemotaxis-specific protein-glutamate methyltransferase CheB [Desulfamplus sp.]
MGKIKVLVVDDTIVYRKIVSDVLKELPDVELVGAASNGKTAVARIASLKPDIVTLDIEMPEMNGIEVLEYIKDNSIPTSAVMLSTLTQKGSDMTIKALELGAFDFISKPDSGTMAENMAKVRASLVPIINAFKRQKGFRSTLKISPPDLHHAASSSSAGSSIISSTTPHSISNLSAAKSSSKANLQKSRGDIKSDIIRPSTIIRRQTPSSIIGIGISTGGPKALAVMMPMLTTRLNVPVLIVQHMPPVFTKSLAKSLNAKCALEVKEAENGEPLRPNTVFIAPGGMQMKIVAGADGRTRNIKITDDPPENSCKPSVDYLFRSIAEHYVGRSTAVIMTGMGSDGTRGLEHIKRNGGVIIAQDKDTCTVYGMPKEPIESGMADVVAPLNQIAEEITKTVI